MREVKIEWPQIKLTLKNSELKMVEETTYLGITFNSKLKWGPHIKQKITNAKKKLFKYKGSMKANWGPPQSSMRWLYTGVIRPGITYGSLIWGKTVMNQFQNDLRRVQGLALMLQGLFRKNTPRRSLEVLSGIEPLHLFIYNQMMKSGYRNLNHINSLIAQSPNISELSTIKYITRELKKLNIPTSTDRLDREHKTRYHERNFELSEDTFNVKWPTIDKNSINVFTDGSMLGGRCGFGVYITEDGYDNEFSSPMPTYSTVFQCELYAVKTAAEMLSDLTEKSIHFYVDSQAALQSLCSNEVNSKTVMSTIKALEEVGTNNRVKLNWIKAHNGHAMNDIADKLARDGSASAGPQLTIPVPDAYIKDLIDKETLARWNSGWIHQEGHRQTKLFFPEIDTRKALSLYKYTKSKYSQAIRWITGFNGLAYQNNKINPWDFPNPNCQLCGQMIEETSSHLIAECPSLLWERMDAFKTFNDLESDDLRNIKIPQLMKFLGNNRVAVMENISEYPLLFVEDYNNAHHDIYDIIANHETSFSSRDGDADMHEASDTNPNQDALALDVGDRSTDTDTMASPPPKRRDRRSSAERTGVRCRKGVG